MPALAAIAPATICRLRGRDTPLQLRPLPGAEGGEPRQPGLQVPRGDGPAHEGALALGGRAGKAGELLKGPGGADGPFRDPLPQQPVGDLAQGRVHVPAQRGELIAAGRVVRQELAGQPSRAERERHGELRLGVPAEHDLHGAAADVEDQQPSRRAAFMAWFTASTTRSTPAGSMATGWPSRA
jgi:hypothetical protein